MDSRKTLFTLLAGAALATVIGTLLTPYTRRKSIVEKARGYTDATEGAVKETVANVKTQLNKMGEDAKQMINEGGNTV